MAGVGSRRTRGLAWLMLAGPVLVAGVVAAHGVALWRYGRVVEAAATYGELYRVAASWYVPAHRWAVASWVAVAVMWLLLAVWSTVWAWSEVASRRRWLLVGLWVPVVQVAVAAGLRWRRAAGDVRARAVLVGWVASALVYAGYVCAPLWRSVDTDGAASGFRFVSGDMAVPGGAVGDGLALVGQSVLAVRGPVGVLLFAALAGCTIAVAWLVDRSVCDGGAR